MLQKDWGHNMLHAYYNSRTNFSSVPSGSLFDIAFGFTPSFGFATTFLPPLGALVPIFIAFMEATAAFIATMS